MIAEFRDHFGAQCSVQESSIDMPGRGLWLGAAVNSEGIPIDGRMLLDRYMVAGLLPTLHEFAATGHIGQEPQEAAGETPAEDVEPDLVSFLVSSEQVEPHRWRVSIHDGQAEVELPAFDDEEEAEDTVELVRGILSRLVTKVQNARLVVKEGDAPPPPAADTPQASTLGTMPLKRALAITGQCVNRCAWHVFGGGEQPPLPDCTLEEMLIANRIVQNTPSKRNPDGTSTLYCHVDPRGVAAEYALKAYEGPAGLLESLGYRLKPNAGE